MRSCCHCARLVSVEVASDRLEDVDVGLNVQTDLLGNAPRDVLVAGDDRSVALRREARRSRRLRRRASGRIPAAASSSAKREVMRFNSSTSGSRRVASRRSSGGCRCRRARRPQSVGSQRELFRPVRERSPADRRTIARLKAAETPPCTRCRSTARRMSSKRLVDRTGSVTRRHSVGSENARRKRVGWRCSRRSSPISTASKSPLAMRWLNSLNWHRLERMSTPICCEICAERAGASRSHSWNILRYQAGETAGVMRAACAVGADGQRDLPHPRMADARAGS